MIKSRVQRRARRGARLALIVLAAPLSARAQLTASSSATPLPGVLVTAPTPFPSAGVAVGKTPSAITVLDAGDLTRGGPANLLRALDDQAPGASFDSASGNPFQPSLVYRGFQASPLQGVPQGLAVYVGGVRFNQPFGDTVNWDLIPALAIDRLTLEGSNPIFGLNAIGGALNLQLKSGFTYQGGEADVSGGSFGQVQADVQFGFARGGFGVYGAATDLRQGGWRDLQSSDLQSLYGDLGWRGDRTEVHLDLHLAQSTLNGPGSSPVELLAADPAAQFTGPNAIKNGYAQASLGGRFALDDQTTLQAVAHGDDFRQNVVNGNAPNDVPCGDGSGLLCSDSGPSQTLGGQTIRAFLGHDPEAYSELDTQATQTIGYGLALQAVHAGGLFGLANRLTVGTSFDGANTDFGGLSRIGGITAVSRVFVGPGVIIDEPGQNVPVRLNVRDAYWGAYGADALDLTSKLTITLSGRFNGAEIDLKDKHGGDLTGDHAYNRFNPAVGASYQASPGLALYAGYAEANRTPTPAELSCASPTASCSLANFFVGDPDLKQVVARTVEAGLRGAVKPRAGVELTYSLGFYRSDLDRDIVFINSPTLGRAYFANIGHTRRQGLDLDLGVTAGAWRVTGAYSHVEATFRSGFVEAAGSNPAADASGDLTIHPGDQFAGVPQNQFKLGVRYQATDRLFLGATVKGRDGAYLFGDEANLTPKLAGYVVVDLDARYQLTPRLAVFARIENAGDTRYATFGTFSPTSTVYLAQAPGATNPRSLSLAAPIGGFGGVEARF